MYIHSAYQETKENTHTIPDILSDSNEMRSQLRESWLDMSQVCFQFPDSPSIVCVAL